MRSVVARRLIGIKFNNLAKVYFFDPNGIDFLVGDKVLVETAVGQSLGVVSIKESRYSIDTQLAMAIEI